MHHEFWQDRWTLNEIGFHQQSINQHLVKHWSDLNLEGHEKVFVPLCGKSKDSLWINQKGHSVLGVELSPIACKDFFEESNLKAQVKQGVPFVSYSHDDIEIWCGDYFSLTPEHLSTVKVVYDRAALIAMPLSMRAEYVNHLSSIIKTGVQILLVCLEYPESEMEGPPFSITTTDVESLYSNSFCIEKLYVEELGRDNPFTKMKGLSEARETIYKLVKR